MNKPKRIQRKRTKGWIMPDNTIYVGRGSKWGNPFKVESRDSFDKKDKDKAIKASLKSYRNFIIYERIDLTKLKGKNLACWCPLDKPCHADILLELANLKEK